MLVNGIAVRRSADQVHMIRVSLLAPIVALAAACASGRPVPALVADSAVTDTIVAAMPVNSMDLAQPQNREAVQRADQAAAAVDTIIVVPDSLTLRVGQVVEPWSAITIDARDATGRPVTHFAPLMRVEDDTIVEQGPKGLVARRPGRTILIISPMSLDPSVRVRDTRAVVVLHVVP